MNSKVVYIPSLVGSNYFSWKRNMIDMLRSKNLWSLTKVDLTKPTDAKELAIWEDRCDQAR